MALWGGRGFNIPTDSQEKTCLIIVGEESVVKIGEKIVRFLKRKIVGVRPNQFPCHTNRFFNCWLSMEIGGKNRLVGIRLYT